MEAIAAYDSERCQVITGDQSALFGWRLDLESPEVHDILPEIISKEPLGPAVRDGDYEWFKIVRWSLFALLNAEELSVTSRNVDDLRSRSSRPEVKRLLGAEGDIGKPLGLDNHWAYRIIKNVGNYGEIFDRHLGPGSPFKIRRGFNALS